MFLYFCFCSVCFLSVLMKRTLKRKKASVFPMKEEDMFIAQKTPEFRVIVVGSELLANRFPWVIRNYKDFPG